MRWLCIAMTAIFVLAAAVQWNDPDPAMWILLYLSAAGLSLSAALGHLHRRITLALLSIYTIGTLATFPAVLQADLSAYTSFKMRSAGDEVARECVGLALCSAWTFFLWRRSPHPKLA